MYVCTNIDRNRDNENNTWHLSVSRLYTTCSARVRATGRQIVQRRERRIYLRRWTRTTTGNWRKTNSWRAVFRMRNCRKCSPLNPEAALPDEPLSRARKDNTTPLLWLAKLDGMSTISYHRNWDSHTYTDVRDCV